MRSSRVQWGRTYSSRFERRLHFLVLQFLPVHVAEEAVLPDVSLPLGTTAQSFRWMLRHQLDRWREEEEQNYCMSLPPFLLQSNLSLCLMLHLLCSFSPILYTFSLLLHDLHLTFTVSFYQPDLETNIHPSIWLAKISIV